MVERWSLLNIIAYVMTEKQKMKHQSSYLTPSHLMFMEWLFMKIINGNLVNSIWRNYEFLSLNSNPPNFLKETPDTYFLHIIQEQQKLIEF